MDEKREPELQVNFLLNLCNLPYATFPKTLKSHYGYLCKKTSALRSVGTRDRLNKVNLCQYCNTPFTCSNKKVKIVPTVKPGPAMRRILSKVKRKKKLSEIEKKLAMRARSGNKLEILCLTCKKKTIICSNKPPKLILNNSVSKIEEADDLQVVTPKKKKKKKKTPILNIQEHLTLKQPVQKDPLDDLIVLDTTGDPSNFKKPILKRTSDQFLPINTSTPVPKKKKKNEVFRNPVAIQNLTKGKNKSTMKKKLAKLKDLISEESPTIVKGNSLKNFLSRL